MKCIYKVEQDDIPKLKNADIKALFENIVRDIEKNCENCNFDVSIGNVCISFSDNSNEVVYSLGKLKIDK